MGWKLKLGLIYQDIGLDLSLEYPLNESTLNYSISIVQFRGLRFKRN